ncbi:NUMOD4 motif-containing HNH endonuclease [Mycobacterium avium]|uniref:NUMOD4 motif-containing HNH endonuclease n=1 Tax=Mycobacterium avium TaxID=1764 RepID=UPI001CC38F74|nr:NUMOD4 motif-containing HNH endonuclease [Mycobacterium avium]MBZ4580992.1 hypothetical protein [Mycobacterium avium subsp. hominissuis]MBZ4608915.1 hypothetical protein [Mycobacterium avium subsp. hominissuis]
MPTTNSAPQGAIWKPIPGYEGLYEVSDEGEVRSLERVVEHGYSGTKTIPARVMRQKIDKGGYRRVGLRRDGKQRWLGVHRLVLAAFVGECPEGQEVCHGNGNRADNRLENLRYGTRSENMLDQIAHGTHNQARKTHCPQGHEYDRVWRNRAGYQRICGQCQREQDKQYRAKKKVAA